MMPDSGSRPAKLLRGIYLRIGLLRNRAAFHCAADLVTPCEHTTPKHSAPRRRHMESWVLRPLSPGGPVRTV